MIQIASILLPVFWAGLLVGVCFIATPAKFLAPSLARPVALDVGRATFAVWNDVEWVVLAMMVPPLLFGPADRFTAVSTLVLGALLFIQSMILLPTLNARVTVIQSGRRPAISQDHRTYIAIDGLKLFILAAIVWRQGADIAMHLSR
jgi:hypothetical protein